MLPRRTRATTDTLLEIGAVRKPHGLKGALVIFSHTRPAIGIAGYSFWHIGETPETAVEYRVRRCWQHGRRMLAELEGVDNADAAQALAGRKIWLPAEAVDVGDDEYLWAELVGCRVYDGETLLGDVIALEEYGAQDILTVRTPDDAARSGEWQLPFIADVVLDVDIAARRIEVRLPEGMDACFTPSC